MKALPVLVLSGLLTACTTASPTLYHTLSVETPGVKTAPAVSSHLPSLGVGPVTLPTLLDREGLVIRKDASTVQVSDTHLWGGQLEDECLTALVQHLQQRLPTTRVQAIPWQPEQAPQKQVALRITRLDGAPGDKATLQGSWQLQTSTDGRLLLTRPFALERPVTGRDIAALVREESLLLADLAEQIVEELRAYTAAHP